MSNLTRPLTRALTQPIARGITDPSIGGGAADTYLPAALALSPVWLYDHKDITSFFTDVAMTTPAAVGDRVAAVKDKSVNARHRTQSTLASRPFLRQSGSLYYLEYDGVDDFMVTPSIDLTGTDAVTLCLGVRRLAASASEAIFEHSANSSGGTANFGIIGLTTSGGTYRGQSRGSTAASADAVVASPATRVITLVSDVSTDTLSLRMDGVSAATSAADQGTGNYSNSVQYFGRRGGSTIPFGGYDFGGALYASALSGTNLSTAEAFVANRTGVFI